MAHKIENILGAFEDMDSKDTHHSGKFLRIKVNIDLKQPRKRGRWFGSKKKSIGFFSSTKYYPHFALFMAELGIS